MLKRAVTTIAALVFPAVAAAYLPVPALAGEVSVQVVPVRISPERAERTRAALVRFAQGRADASLYADLPKERREHLQRMMVWSGDYQGAIDGAIGAGSLQAIERFRARHPEIASEGLITAEEFEALASESDAAFAEADFTRGVDTDAGISFGMPYAFVKWQEKTESGNLYADEESRFRVTTFRIEGVDGTNVEGFAASVFEDVPGYAAQSRKVRGDYLEVRGADRYENLLLRAVRKRLRTARLLRLVRQGTH